MDEQTQSTGGAGGVTGGAGSSASDDSSQNSNQNSATQPKVVPWDVHDRAMSDLQKQKDKNRELESRIGAIESKSLQEKNDYKSLWERSESDKKKLEQDLQNQSNWIVKTQQFNEVKAEAVAAGLRKEALKDLDLIEMDGVDVETTSTGRFIVKGAKQKVESLKQEKPHWFTVEEPPKVNTGGTGAGDVRPGQRLSATDVVQAERDWKRGKITKQKYHEVYQTYCKQNPKNAIPTVGETGNNSSTQK